MRSDNMNQKCLLKQYNSGATLLLSIGLIGCGPIQLPEHSLDSGNIQGIVIAQNAGWGVHNATVTLHKNGQNLGTFKTNHQGEFKIPNLTLGTYDLKVRKKGMAGTNVYGFTVSQQSNKLRIVQQEAFEQGADPTPPQLEFFRKDGKTPLANSIFKNQMDMIFKLSPNSSHLPPLRLMMAQLNRTPGSYFVQGSSTRSAWFKHFKNMNDHSSGILEFSESQNQSSLFLKGFGSSKGERLFLEVIAIDLNHNRAHYYVPIIFQSTNPVTQNQVVAPIQAAATAITVRYEGGSWTTPFSSSQPRTQAAPYHTNMYVDLRWCYTNQEKTALPHAFDIERAIENSSFIKIGTVGGGANSFCPKDHMARPFQYRDNSAELKVGQKVRYRVVARSANKAISNITQTTPLNQFRPQLKYPTSEASQVSLQPIFKIKSNQLEIGADGIGLNIQLRDIKSSKAQSMPGKQAFDLIRIEEGTGFRGNQIPKGKALVFIQKGSWIRKIQKENKIATDPSGIYDPQRPNHLPINHQIFNLPLTYFSKEPLQPLRSYAFDLYSALAYKYEPTEEGRISAYSVYTWPNGTIAPIRAPRPLTLVHDFLTRDQPK